MQRLFFLSDDGRKQIVSASFTISAPVKQPKGKKKKNKGREEWFFLLVKSKARQEHKQWKEVKTNGRRWRETESAGWKHKKFTRGRTWRTDEAVFNGLFLFVYPLGGLSQANCMVQARSRNNRKGEKKKRQKEKSRSSIDLEMRHTRGSHHSSFHRTHTTHRLPLAPEVSPSLASRLAEGQGAR